MRWRQSTRAAMVAVLVCGTAVGQVGSAQASSTTSPSDVAVSRANEAIDTHRDAIRAATDDRYTVWRVIVTPAGTAHVRYTREFRGLPVLGGDFVVHLDAAGHYAGVSVSLDRPVDAAVEAKVTAAQAAQAARDALRAVEVGMPQQIVDAVDTSARLAWQVPVTLAEGGATAFVDAVDGRVLRTIRDEQEVEGMGHTVYSGTVRLSTTLSGGLYSMVDPLRGNAVTCDMKHTLDGPCATFTDATNVWGNSDPAFGQTAAADVAYGAASTFDYYKNVLNRNGVFGDGVGVTARVHTGSQYGNAVWNRTEKVMKFGDGAGDVKPLVSLDIVAHEMTHGVTQASIPPDGLIYTYESGALNEATSDIFATMTEFNANSWVDVPDYLIAERVDFLDKGPLRYMYDPSLDGKSKNCWYPGVGGMDPHYSSGIGNHLFFLLAEGSGATPHGTSPTCDGSSLVGIGRTKAAQIWYQALDAYFTANETYEDARGDTLAAAAELYGMCSTEHYSVAAAWAAVGIGKTLSLMDCLPTFHLVDTRWPMCPIPDMGPLRWVTTLDQVGSLGTIEVGVNIAHSRRGDLQLELVAPDGRSYRLMSPNPRDVAADVIKVFKVELPKAAQAGEWTLVVQDMVRGEKGRLNGWSLVY